MKYILKGKPSVVFLVFLILSSCASHRSKNTCPSYGSSRVKISKKNKKYFNLLDFREVLSLKKRQKPIHKRILVPVDHEGQIANFEDIDSNFMASAESENSFDLVAQPYFNPIKRNQNKETDNQSKSDWKVQKSKRFTKINMGNVDIRNHIPSKDSLNAKKKTDVDIQQKSKRKEAIIKGGSILLMAIVAGISIPALGTVTASIGLVAILLLDVLVSIGIIRYYRKEKPKLAKTTGFLRLLYSAIFGIGIGYHIFGNVAMFNKFWSLGLIAFGFHLIALGILFNNEGGKKWVNYTIKSLLIIAGIGYTLLNVGLLFTANPIAFTTLINQIFIAPQILGEVLFALWMIIKGGKK